MLRDLTEAVTAVAERLLDLPAIRAIKASSREGGTGGR